MDRRGIGEIALGRDYVHRRHHAFKCTIVPHPVIFGVPSVGLLVYLDLPTIVILDQKCGPARRIGLRFAGVRIVMLPKLDDFAHRLRVLPSAG